MDTGYIFVAKSVSSTTYLINFAMHKIKLATLAAGVVTNNFIGATEKFVASHNAFSFMSSVKETPEYWKQLLYNILTKIK